MNDIPERSLSPPEPHYRNIKCFCCKEPIQYYEICYQDIFGNIICEECRQEDSDRFYPIKASIEELLGIGEDYI
jgi:hypothetical protein